MSISDNPFGLPTTSPTAFNDDGPDSTRSPSRPAGSPPAPIAHSSSSYHGVASPPNTTPGGTLMVSGAGNGTKTPRRIQWTSDSHIVSIHETPAAPGSPSGTLDESNIDEVREALERHRANPSRQRRMPTTLSMASSVGDESHQGEDEDYDYRLDVDPLPGQNVERQSTGASVLSATEHTSLQTILDDGIMKHITEFVQLGETDGLPNVQQTEAKDELSEAKDLVRAHTGKWGVLRRRVKGAGAVNRAFASKATALDPEKAGRELEPFALRYPEPVDDPERRGPEHGRKTLQTGMVPIPAGASVLSSLLALYGQQGLPSGTTTPASSRPASEDGSSDEDERSQSVPRRSDGRHAHVDGAQRYQDAANAPPMIVEPNDRDLAGPRSRGLGTQSRSKSTTSLVEPPPPSPSFLSVLKKARQDKDRPKAARSGAGVFGALIQNTGSLSGAATPTASTLAPAAKRPGYQLGRYSLSEPDAAAARLASGPGSVHSSTAVSRSGDSPNDDTSFKNTLSSDDMLIMRGEKQRPRHVTLDSLGRLPGRALKEGGYALKQTEKWILSGGKTPLITPPEKGMPEYFHKPLTLDERKRREWEAEKKRRKKQKEARKQQLVFITQHVAAILARQQFLMKLARALMMFGSPSHRLETQIQATAKVLDINAQVVYLPGTMLISFLDDTTHTSDTKFLKQATGLDLGKLLATHHVYWNVVHDRISVDEASKDLDLLMTARVYYSWWQTLIIGAACSAFITVIGFYGSFIDALMAMPLGMTLVGVQMLSARNDMFNNVFEIAMATLISFVAAALASTHVFCYTALVSGGVVLILPGYIVLSGSLELASRNITAGAVRIGYSVIYSLFLGFGISIGAELYQKITGNEVLGASDYTCGATHSNAPWYQVTPSPYWWFLCAPAYSFFLSLRNQQPLIAKELPIMVLIACAGWASNHFSALAFPGRSDMTSAIGSFVVGTLGNIYGRFFNGSSFPVTVTGILFQLPSGLANGGIFNFAAESTTGNSTQAYGDGFSVAEQLISVAIGLTVGLFVSAVVTHPFGGGRRSGSGIFSF